MFTICFSHFSNLEIEYRLLRTVVFLYFCIFEYEINMRQNLLQIFKQGFDVIFLRQQAWGAINNEDKSEQELFKSYTLPLIGCCTLCVFVFKLIYGNGFQIAFLEAVITAISFLGTHFITKEALHFFLEKNYDSQTDRTDVAKLVSYGFTAIYFVEIAEAIVPSFFLFKIFLFYTYFLVLDGCKILFDFPQNKLNNVVLLVFLLMLILPFLLTFVVKMFLPNAQF